MKFENTKELNDNDFKLLTGINRKTFSKMINILKIAKQDFFYKGGRKSKLTIEDRLLMALEYWREYRTYFHIAYDFGINKTTCIRNIHWIEDTLVKHPDFQQLSGQKTLIKEHFKDKTLIIDVTETPIQRPKKVKNNIIQEKRVMFSNLCNLQKQLCLINSSKYN